MAVFVAQPDRTLRTREFFRRRSRAQATPSNTDVALPRACARTQKIREKTPFHARTRRFDDHALSGLNTRR
jgi:hypothetical protein